MKIPINSLSCLLTVVVVLVACKGQTGGAGAAGSANALAQEEQRKAGSGQVVGFVFEDRNGNGTFDSTDVRVPKQIVRVTDPSRGKQFQSATTGEDGSFRFDKLVAGEYRLSLEVPKGFVRTSDDSFTFVATETGPPLEVQFGIAPRQEP